MKTALILAAAAAIATSSAAQASTILSCNVIDSQGSRLIYAFGSNAANTLVETGFEKNGTMVMSEVGQRPIWIYGDNALGGFNLNSRAAPGWTLTVASGGATILTHNGRFAGSGNCQAARPTRDTVGDIGE